ncbi:MAG: DUF354 domain-containing protein [bacterium]
MRILIDLCHPAHVHFFKYAIRQWQSRGDQVILTARDKDITLALLDHYSFTYSVLSKITPYGRKTHYRFFREFVLRESRLFKVIRRLKPHVVTAIGGAFIAPVCTLANVPSVVFTDTEHVFIDRFLTYPLASLICTPDCFNKKAGPRQVRYPGLHELAYLHPRRFTPDPELVRKAGIDPEQKYCILRFVSWQAHHDIGQQGFADNLKFTFVQEIARYAVPYITSEEPLPQEFEPYRLKIPFHHIHHVMAYASLCVGEGATMASESAILGVPAVYINSLRLGYIDMLTDFGLVRQAQSTAYALEHCISWLTDPQAKEKYRSTLKKMLADKIDMTDYIVRTIEKVVDST